MRLGALLLDDGNDNYDNNKMTNKIDNINNHNIVSSFFLSFPSPHPPPTKEIK